MPLDVNRLRRSKTWLVSKRMPELAFYVVNLWTASWHEVPAASIEDDDDVLADFAMCDPKRWKKIKVEALRGWIKCSDGRLYHPVVAEKAIDSWFKKVVYAWAKECDRIRKSNKKRESDKLPPLPFPDEPTLNSLFVPKKSLGISLEIKGIPGERPDLSKTENWNVDDFPTESALKGEGEVEVLKASVPGGTGDKSPPIGLSSQGSIFQIAVPWLIANGGKESNARSLLGGAVKQLGADSAWELASECMRENPIEAMSWIAAGINSRMKTTKNSRHSGFEKVDYNEGITADGRIS